MSQPQRLSPECPECGGRFARSINSGADARGHFVRDRKCQDCGTKFATIEFVVPGVPFNRIDVERKFYQKEWLRKKRGFWGQRSRKAAYQDDVKVKIYVRRDGETVWELVGEDPRASGRYVRVQLLDDVV